MHFNVLRRRTSQSLHRSPGSFPRFLYRTFTDDITQMLCKRFRHASVSTCISYSSLNSWHLATYSKRYGSILVRGVCLLGLSFFKIFLNSCRWLVRPNLTKGKDCLFPQTSKFIINSHTSIQVCTHYAGKKASLNTLRGRQNVSVAFQPDSMAAALLLLLLLMFLPTDIERCTPG